jgi:hypothetical protein
MVAAQEEEEPDATEKPDATIESSTADWMLSCASRQLRTKPSWRCGADVPRRAVDARSTVNLSGSRVERLDRSWSGIPVTQCDYC